MTFLPWREEDEALKGEEWLEDRVLVLVEREEEMGVEKGGGGTEVCFMEGRGAEGVGVFVSAYSRGFGTFSKRRVVWDYKGLWFSWDSR